MSKNIINFTVADVIKTIDFHKKPAYVQKTFRSILKCRTSEMGGHECRCVNCDHIEKGYNSCGNRACPTCSGRKQQEWIIKEVSDVLPCKYFHMVFTIPHEFNSFYIYNKKEFTNLILYASKKALLDVIKKKWKVNGGAVSIIHTWGSSLSIHPHVHMIVPAGGFDCKSGDWKEFGKYYLADKKQLAFRFRNIFMKRIKKVICSGEMKCPSEHGFIMSNEAAWMDFFDIAHKKKWNCKPKETLENEVAVIKYLGGYTHKIAISNYRIQKVENGRVTFSYKNYKDKSLKNQNFKDSMTMTCEEFARRFGHHVPEPRTVRIRHIGCLAGVHRKENILKARVQTKNFGKRKKEIDRVVSELMAKLKESKIKNEKRLITCEKCNGMMKTFKEFDKSGAPVVRPENSACPRVTIDSG